MFLVKGGSRDHQIFLKGNTDGRRTHKYCKPRGGVRGHIDGAVRSRKRWGVGVDGIAAALYPGVEIVEHRLHEGLAVDTLATV